MDDFRIMMVKMCSDEELIDLIKEIAENTGLPLPITIQELLDRFERMVKGGD